MTIELFKQDFKLYASAHQSHLDYRVEVPAGVQQLKVLFDYQPLLETKLEALERAFLKEGLPAELAQDQDGFRNLLTITIQDNQGFRGAHHYFNTQQEIILAPDQASLGFRPDPIDAGIWTFTISCHGLFSDFVTGSLRVLADFSFDQAKSQPQPLTSVVPLAQPAKNRPLSDPQARFYKTELHSHTLHSDAQQSTEYLLQQAQEQGIDWLAITDHNTTTAHDEAAAHHNYDTQVHLIPGMEYTSFHGHMLIHGAYNDIVRNWTELNPYNIDQITEELQAQGLNVTVAHPFVEGNPYCTGCRWDYLLHDLKYVDTLEVWNRQNPNNYAYNQAGFAKWLDFLAMGYEINASTGRDWHTPAASEDQLAYTYVLAPQEADLDQILQALKLGRTYISLGPLIASCILDGKYQLGDRVPLKQDSYNLLVNINELQAADKVLIYGRQNLLKEIHCHQAGSFEIKETLQLEQESLLRIEVRDQAGKLKLFTNPIYIG